MFLFVVFYFQNVFLYKSTTRTAFNLRKTKGREKEKIYIDQKYLDILHTWDSLTKMQQIYDLNFQTIYLLTKGKIKGWLHFLT